MSKLTSNMKATIVGNKKMMFFCGTAIVFGLSYALSPSPEQQVSASSVVVGDMNRTQTLQGGEALSEAYLLELDRADQQRAEQAKLVGGSTMPTLRPGATEQMNPIPVLDIAPPEIEEITTPEIDAGPILLNAPPPPPEHFVTPVQALPTPPPAESVRAIVTNMQQFRRANPVAEVTILQTAQAASPATQPAPQVQPVVPSSASGAGVSSKMKMPMAGQILYAQMLSRADSDAPGPVLAKIVQGDLAGATLIGSFTKTQDALVIKFDRLSLAVDRSGNEINETVAVNTYAVSTDYIGTALATHVDRHLFQKVAISFVSGFASGLGEVISSKGETTVSSASGSVTTTAADLSATEELYAASGNAVSQVGGILMEEYGRRPTTIRVEQGTPIGILFL